MGAPGRFASQQILGDLSKKKKKKPGQPALMNESR
jgi:hypothetical protein